MVSMGHGVLLGWGLSSKDLQAFGFGDILGSVGLGPAVGSLPHFVALGDMKLITSVLSH